MKPLALSCLSLLIGSVSAQSLNRIGVPSRIGARLAAGERLHIVVYGTSLTSGGAWPRQMRDAIERLYPGQIRLTDTAKSGEHSDWGVANFKSRVLDHHPDVLFLEFAVNDAVRRFHIPLARSRRNLDAMIDRARAQNPNVEVVLQTTNPVIDRPKWDPGYRPYLYNYFNVVREAAAAKGTVLIDQETAWQKVLSEGRDAYHAVVPDGLHPSPRGYAQVATPRILRTMDLRDPRPPLIAWAATAAIGSLLVAGALARRKALTSASG